jgi:YD repeat-containing protein
MGLLVKVALLLLTVFVCETCVDAQSLPPGWSDGDVGSVGVAGNASYANGTFTVNGAGQWMGYSADSLHFVYLQMSGDETIIARLASIQGTTASAGLMVRDSLTGSAATSSIYYTQGSMYLESRYAAGDGPSSSSQTSVVLPRWVKLVRSGNQVSVYESADWVNWTSLSTSYNGFGQTIYVGFGVSSGNTSSLATATFDYVSVSTTANPAPLISSLSATTGMPGSQVTIYGSGFGASQGVSAVLLNGTPVTINSWSATSISITIPTGATSGPLVVSVAPSMNDSNPMEFAVTSQPLPSGWLDQDVGQVGILGSATFANNTFAVQAGGNDFSGENDQMHFVYQPLFGDGTIVARVVSVQGATGASGGVMIRQSLNSSDASAFVGQSGTGINFIVRGGSGYYSFNSGSISNAPCPYWVKLVRTGNTFTAYVADDGVNWVQLGYPGQAISMAENVYVGLAFSGNSTTALGTANFDYVSLSTSITPAPTITGLSTTSGPAGSQVTITGGGFGATQGNGAVVLNDASVTVSAWSDASITVTIPYGAVSGYMAVSLAPSMNDSNSVYFDVTSQPLPSPWLDQDVGQTGIAGSATYSNGTFVVQGGGAGLYNEADGMHFAYQTLSGNGQIVARLVSLQQNGSSAAAGLMIRGDLSSNTGTALAYVQSGTSEMGARGAAGYDPYVQSGPNITLPCWFKLVQSNGFYNGYESSDGNSWVQIGGGDTFTLPTNVYVGLQVSSGNTTSLATATFDNVSITTFGQPLPIPKVSSVMPTYGAIGQPVAIYGANFGAVQGSGSISFNGTQATTIVDWSSGRIIAIVPNGATTGAVTVSANGYQSNSNVSFTVVNPVISSLSPPSAAVGGTVTLSGSGFGSSQSLSTVQFNGATVPIQSWSDTSITTTVPSSASSGPVTVTEEGVVGVGPNFTLIGPVSISTISPTSGPAGTTVTIDGSGFGSQQSNSFMTFNGTPAASITSWSDTQIQAVVPAIIATGPVNVNVANIVGQGPTFTLTTSLSLSDSLGNQSTYQSVLEGGEWHPFQGQGSGCSTCTQRGNISYTYDSSGNPLSRTDENGNTTTYTYDTNGNVTSVTQQVGGTNLTTSYTSSCDEFIKRTRDGRPCGHGGEVRS